MVCCGRVVRVVEHMLADVSDGGTLRVWLAGRVHEKQPQPADATKLPPSTLLATLRAAAAIAIASAASSALSARATPLRL